MSRHSEPQAKAEAALHQTLRLQGELLSRTDSEQFLGVSSQLNELAKGAFLVIQERDYSKATLQKLTSLARDIESEIDRISAEIWKNVKADLSVFFDRIQWAMVPRSEEESVWKDVRSHYNNQRISLLQQALGARMLDSNSDLGDEIERIFHDYLKLNLGAAFKVVRGGKIRDQKGNVSAQIDLIVVAGDAQVMTPSNAAEGKSHVFVEQVISAFMITSTLSRGKLRTDWEALQTIPEFAEFREDYPEIAKHCWPFCYVIAAQSDSLEKLKEEWIKLSSEGQPKHVPQFLVTLDEGFLTSGARKWPAPRYPGNFTEANQVMVSDGIYSGLGLAWVLLQQRGRLAVIRRQNLSPLKREVELLDDSSMTSVMDTFSPRLWTHTGFQKIGGGLVWGGRGISFHNKLSLRTLAFEMGERWGEFMKGELAPRPLRDQNEEANLRWFREGWYHKTGRLVALEEWIDPKLKQKSEQRIVVFDVDSCREVSLEGLPPLKTVQDLESVAEKLMEI